MAKKYWIYKGQKIPVKKYNPQTKKTSDTLYRELIRKTGQANKRLRSIRNEFGTLGWAGNKLKEKTEINLLNAWRSKGIKVNKNMSEQQQRAILKAIDNFLQSKTSTIKGIKSTMKKTQQSIRQELSNEDINLSVEESQTLYSFFGDKDFNYITSYIPASDLFALLEDSKESNDSFNSFVDRIENYIVVGNDDDMIKALESIYNKYVRS